MYVLLRVIVKEFLQLRHDRSLDAADLRRAGRAAGDLRLRRQHRRHPRSLLLVDQDRRGQPRARRELLAGEHFELVGVEYGAKAIDRWLVSGAPRWRS